MKVSGVNSRLSDIISKDSFQSDDISKLALVRCSSADSIRKSASKPVVQIYSAQPDTTSKYLVSSMIDKKKLDLYPISEVKSIGQSVLSISNPKSILKKTQSAHSRDSLQSP